MLRNSLPGFLDDVLKPLLGVHDHVDTLLGKLRNGLFADKGPIAELD